LHQVGFLASWFRTGFLLAVRLLCRCRDWELGRLERVLIWHSMVDATLATPYLNGTIAGFGKSQAEPRRI
jgi:hypothetical protein